MQFVKPVALCLIPFLWVVTLSAQHQAKPQAELVTLIEKGVWHKFLNPPVVQEVASQVIVLAITKEIKSRTLALPAGRGEPKSIGSALGSVLPVWFDQPGNRVLVCRESAIRLAKVSGDGALISKEGFKVLRLFGLLQACDSFRFNFPVTGKWLNSGEECKVFDSLRWGHAWYWTVRLGTPIGLGGEIKAWSRALGEVVKSPSLTPDTRADCLKERARYSSLWRIGAGFCTHLMAKNKRESLVGLMCRPFLTFAQLRKPDKCKFDVTKSAHRAGVEWALKIFTLNAPRSWQRIASYTANFGEEVSRKPGARSVKEEVSVHRRIAFRPERAGFSECAATLTVFTEKEVAQAFHKLCKGRHLADLKGDAKSFGRIKKLHQINVGGQGWIGSSGKGLLHIQHHRLACTEFIAMKDCAVLQLRYRGVERSERALVELCGQIFKGLVAGGPRSNTESSKTTEPFNREVSFDQLRQCLGLDFCGRAEQMLQQGIAEAYARLMGKDLSGYRLSGIKLHPGDEWWVGFKMNPPVAPGGFFYVRINNAKGIISYVPGF